MINKNFIKIIFFALLLGAGQVAGYRQAVAASFVPAEERIKLLAYNESDVYVIRTKYGYQTNIVFAPHEEIKTISVGDRSLWQIIPEGNRLFIRPLSDNITTNMTLLTNKHSYEFDLKAVDGRDGGNIYVAKFVYPPQSGTQAANASVLADKFTPELENYYTATAKPVQLTQNIVNVKGNQIAEKNVISTLESRAVSPNQSPAVSSNLLGAGVDIGLKPAKKSTTQKNYNYTYSGADNLAPQMVYDNGKSTFIVYKTVKKPLPEVFLVTPLVKGNNLVINDIADEIVVRDAGGDVRIYNESLKVR
jgi:type IV secretory pathway VirB9-like protein